MQPATPYWWSMWELNPTTYVTKIILTTIGTYPTNNDPTHTDDIANTDDIDMLCYIFFHNGHTYGNQTNISS